MARSAAGSVPGRPVVVVAEPGDLVAELGLAVQPGPGHSSGFGEPAEGDWFTAPRQTLQGVRGAAQGRLVPGLRRFAETINPVRHRADEVSTGHIGDRQPPHPAGRARRGGHGSRERFHDRAFDSKKRRRGHAQTAPELGHYPAVSFDQTNRMINPIGTPTTARRGTIPAEPANRAVGRHQRPPLLPVPARVDRRRRPSCR